MANKYYYGSGNIGSATNWRTADNGGGVVTTPAGTSDNAYFTASTGDIAGFTSNWVWTGFFCVGYTGALDTGAYYIAVISALNINTETINITGKIQIGYTSTACTVANIGLTLPCAVNFVGTGAKTISGGELTAVGKVVVFASMTMNGFKLIAQQGIESDTTTARTITGTTELWVQGGRLYYIIKRTGGKVMIDGDVVFESRKDTSTLGIYDSILAYNSGNPTVAGDTVFGFYGTSTVDASVEDNIIFQNIDFSGTLTLNCDIYAYQSIASIGTSNVTLLGVGTVHFGYGGGIGHLIMYNLGTFISTTCKLICHGTGTLFNGVSYNGMVFAPLSSLKIDLELDTSGTVTFYSGSPNKFGNGRSLTVTNVGSVVTTGCTFYTDTGGYSYNINFVIPILTGLAGATATMISSDATVTTINAYGAVNFQNTNLITNLNMYSGSSVSGAEGLTITNLYQGENSSLSAPTDKIINVTTILEAMGSPFYTANILTSPINTPDFVANRATTKANSLTGFTITSPSFTNLTTFRFAFDYIYIGTGLPALLGQGDGYLWLPNSYVRFYFFMDASNAYYFSHGMSINGVKHRIVISKENGGDMKCWVDGVSKSYGYQGSIATLRAGNFTFDRFSYQAVGDFLFYQTPADQAWVDADYAKFLENNRSSNMQYDNTELNLTCGWHVDTFTGKNFGAKLKYDGTIDNVLLANTNIGFIDASISAVPLVNWGSNSISSENIIDVKPSKVVNKVGLIGG